MRSILFLTLILFIAGCASSNNSRSFAFKTPEAAVKPEYGYLKIYTHSYSEEPRSFSSDGDESEPIIYTPYKIYGKDGSLVKQVYSTEQTPLTVKLAKGEYVIVAEMSEGEESSYKVTIEPGLVLEVDSAMLENAPSKVN